MNIDMERVKILRDHLRDPKCRVGPNDPVQAHRTALALLWQLALERSGGDIAQSLGIIREAVRADPQPGETEEGYLARIAGIPTGAFGTTAPYAGVDKPQHFFAIAYWSYVSGKYLSSGGGRAVSNGLGRMYEWKDAFLKTIRLKDTAEYDAGDIHADDRGAEFASFLLTSPTAPINLFLRMPGESRFGRFEQLGQEDNAATRLQTGDATTQGEATDDTATYVFLPDFRTPHTGNGDAAYSPTESDPFVPPALDEVLHAINILVWSDRTSLPEQSVGFETTAWSSADASVSTAR